MGSGNQLRQATSPYLLQHADNLVDWRPWTPKVLEEARCSGKPILLSVGYSSCHWCHVMAHESFEDATTAALMNDLFVCVKVDREERPDIDHIYMTALRAFGEQGGWPLTMFLDGSGAPFWGGTYFPPEPRYGRPSFRQVLTRVAQVYRSDPTGITRTTQLVVRSVCESGTPAPGRFPDQTDCLRLAEGFLRLCDPEHGGLSGAPKFPNMPVFRFLWQVGTATHRQDLLDAVHTLLTRMSLGGIFDQLAGGFARYSTDEEWLAPHFEKMLYDNAQLVELLSYAYGRQPNQLYRHAAFETVNWMLREMSVLAPGVFSAFAASQDADTDGVEGQYYTWTSTEIDEVLEEKAKAFRQAYDVTEGGNWEGRSILRRVEPFDKKDKFASDRACLLAHRLQRPRPDRDGTVLADWNGLAITALARAAGVFDQPEWLTAAIGAYDYVRTHMFSASDGYAHAARRGTVAARGLLDDHASMARAALALHEATDDAKYLAEARSTVELAGTLFGAEDGTFYLTAVGADDLPGAAFGRPRAFSDGAAPSGASIIAEVLARLYLLTGADAYRVACQKLIEASAGAGAALAHAPALAGAALLLSSGGVIEVSGRADLIQAMIGTARREADPNLCILRNPDLEDEAVARVCRANVCSAPVHTPEDLSAAIRA